MNNRLDSITIVGGGTAGWLIALFLVTTLNRGDNKSNVKVTVIESPKIPTIGVGEATVTGMYRFLKQMNIDEAEFIRRSDATFKCSGRFVGWNLDKNGNPITFVNPFNTGGMVSGIESAYHFHKYGREAGARSYADNTLPTEAVVENARGPRLMDSKDYEAVIPYTYHLNAGTFSQFLRDIAIERGVEHIQDDMLDVELDEQGFVSALQLEQGGRYPVKFVFDCTGFRSLILQKALGEPFIPYDKHLLVDRAVPIMIPHQNPLKIKPCTNSTALSAGWAWRVPLFHRAGTGYVFSSKFVSDDQAIDEMLAHLGDEAPKDFEPRVIPMRVGRIRRPWVKNCIAAGLSAGFVEPLEATAIYTIEMTARWFLTYFPDKEINASFANRFNEIMDRQYKDILNFIVMNYYTSNRTDPFWLAARNEIEVPDRLRENLELWKHTLPSAMDTDDTFLFQHWDYLYILLGKGYFKGRHFPSESVLSRRDWKRHSRRVAEAKAQLLARLPNHYELLLNIRDGGSTRPEVAHLQRSAPQGSARPASSQGMR